MTETDDPATRSYRNPPVEHRFRKGASGNPKGRPRKKRAFVSTKVDGQPGIGFEDRIKSLAIEEAYRLITIREGDRVEKIPVIQAILRKVAVAAANGNTRAQQNYLNLLIGAEADRRVATMELRPLSTTRNTGITSSLSAPARERLGQSRFLTPTTSSSTTRLEISGLMARSWRTKRRRGISCAPCGQSSNES
jgi:hypothetical protein